MKRKFLGKKKKERINTTKDWWGCFSERHLNRIFRAEILERKKKWETTLKARKEKK